MSTFIIYSNSSMSVSGVSGEPGLLDANCWPTWPQWECNGANIAGLFSTAVWFIVLLPQVIKNFWRKSVSGLSFLWAVANFTASLVNLFFNFSVELPVYKRVSAVYMPVLELTILGQFMLYSKRPVTTRLLALLVCLIVWGGIIELELNLPESTDKLQWIAVALWSIETFPQIILNLELQSTEGQSTLSVVTATLGKSTDFLATFGLNIPLPYAVMCYYSSSSAFINGFQVAWYGKHGWFSKKSKSVKIDSENNSEKAHLLSDDISRMIQEQSVNSMNPSYTQLAENAKSQKTFKYLCVNIIRFLSMLYIGLGLVIFAMAFFLRTSSFISILAPVSCVLVVMSANEYYKCKQTKGCGQLMHG